jgi:alpha-glucuronidase
MSSSFANHRCEKEAESLRRVNQMTNHMKTVIYIFFYLSITIPAHAEDGYRLWLRYDLVNNSSRLASYKQLIKGWMVDGTSPTLNAASSELSLALRGLLGLQAPSATRVDFDGIVCAKLSSPLLKGLNIEVPGNTADAFAIVSASVNRKKTIVVTAREDIGILYGVFHLLRMIQTQQDLTNLRYSSAPRIQLRMLNHWDNLDRTVERGYAGFSLWDWHRLPEYIDPRYTDYARANASIGINAASITNVNANARILSPDYLEKARALADVFRPYGIKVFLTARFSAPIEAGGLKTADPLDPEVKEWWKKKAAEIYQYIPDFGGFLVKANSEGQPGPQNYNRSHADGANMLADAVQPFGGVVIWRAFVYDSKVPDDRAKQAYNEFKPLDGTFRNNVLVQVKNGAIDFQPREPFHPMFGAMPQTPLMMEFQITQEYLGFATHLVYLATLFKECLEADTYAKGAGSTVAKVIDGSLEQHKLTGMAGVANTGSDRNWTGHLFGQANWYAFGRLAWDHQLTADGIAEEWIRMTFGNSTDIVSPIRKMMMSSRENTVNYMTPLGLHHIMGANHHFGPGPWVSKMSRPDWTSTYYHKADENGIGFDRTEKGSNATGQYFPEVARKFNDINACPEEYLLWFHHVAWDHRMKSGRTLWEEMCLHYYAGVDSVRGMQRTWQSMRGKVDEERFEQVKMLLAAQEKEAVMWRNSCVLYFQTFSKKPIPRGLEQPEKDLSYYMGLEFPYAPGIRPRW